MSEKSGSLEAALLGLHTACETAIKATLASEDAKRLGKCFDFQNDLEVWAAALSGHPEIALHKTAGSEYTLALFNVAQGQYRNAFKGLRLVLELLLQGT